LPQSAGAAEPFLVEEEYRLALLDAGTSYVEEFIGSIADPDTMTPDMV